MPIDFPLVRNLILALGWPSLVVGSLYILFASVRFYRRVRRSAFGKLVLIMVAGWLVTMYSLGITATAFMFSDVERGVLLVLPIFLVWAGTMGIILAVARRWSVEADAIAGFHDQIEHANRTRTTLIRNVAHELQTPLTPIQIQLYLLLTRDHGDLNPAQEESLIVVERNVRRLRDVVDGTLDLDRIQQANLVVERRPLLLDQMLWACVESSRAMADAAGVTVELVVREPVGVEGDPRRLAQVFRQLIENSMKFTNPGGRVTVEVGQKGDEALVRVHDTGLGIRPQDMPRLFQPFSQLFDPMQKTKAGAGLGLYITKSIVEQHGGRIWAESSGVNRGATFTVAMPVLRRGPTA